jgi:hypothetical protein
MEITMSRKNAHSKLALPSVISDDSKRRGNTKMFMTLRTASRKP